MTGYLSLFLRFLA